MNGAAPMIVTQHSCVLYAAAPMAYCGTHGVLYAVTLGTHTHTVSCL